MKMANWRVTASSSLLPAPPPYNGIFHCINSIPLSKSKEEEDSVEISRTDMEALYDKESSSSTDSRVVHVQEEDLQNPFILGIHSRELVGMRGNDQLALRRASTREHLGTITFSSLLQKANKNPATHTLWIGYDDLRDGSKEDTGSPLPPSENAMMAWGLGQDDPEDLMDTGTGLEYETSSMGNTQDQSPSLPPYLLCTVGQGEIRPGVWFEMALARLSMLRLVADNYTRFGNGRFKERLLRANMRGIYKDHCPWKDFTGDRLSHIVLSLLVFQSNEASSLDKDWFAEQERRLVEYRLKEYIEGRGPSTTEEGSFLLLLEQNGGFPDWLEETQDRKQGMIRSWRTYYREEPMPKRWFRVRISNAPELFAAGRCLVQKGWIYCGYRHILDHVIPWMAQSCIAWRTGIDPSGPLSDWIEDTTDELVRARAALDTVGRPLSSHAFSAPAPASLLAPGPEDLPEIEECNRQGRFPLCIRILFTRMDMNRSDGMPPRLCYEEISTLRNTLWESGYSRHQTSEFFRRSFVEKHGMNEDYFNREYGARLGASCKWERGKYSRRYDQSCRALQDPKVMEDKRNAKNEIGCPFSLLDGATLDAALAGPGGVAQQEARAAIVQVAKENGNPAAACRLFYQLYHSGETPARRIGYPSDYFKITFPLDQSGSN